MSLASRCCALGSSLRRACSSVTSTLWRPSSVASSCSSTSSPTSRASSCGSPVRPMCGRPQARCVTDTVLRPAGAPNFRPRFRYFTWHTALAGALLCFTILFISGPTYATISIIVRRFRGVPCGRHPIRVAGIRYSADPLLRLRGSQVVALLWIYVHYTAPVTSWGDVTQALIYHQVCVWRACACAFAASP